MLLLSLVREGFCLVLCDGLIKMLRCFQVGDPDSLKTTVEACENLDKITE